MRDLKRNKQTIYYQNNNGAITTDEDGNEVQGYGQINKYELSISTGTSYSNGEVFGRDIVYDREMSSSDLNCPINEYSRVWIDNTPQQMYDYQVVAKKKSLNAVRYAIKKVNVSGD